MELATVIPARCIIEHYVRGSHTSRDVQSERAVRRVASKERSTLRKVDSTAERENLGKTSKIWEKERCLRIYLLWGVYRRFFC